MWYMWQIWGMFNSLQKIIVAVILSFCIVSEISPYSSPLKCWPIPKSATFTFPQFKFANFGLGHFLKGTFCFFWPVHHFFCFWTSLAKPFCQKTSASNLTQKRMKKSNLDTGQVKSRRFQSVWHRLFNLFIFAGLCRGTRLLGPRYKYKT